MARQLQVNSKELLIIGDSNVERNILHTGRMYSQYAESIPARNLSEFSTALSKVKPDMHKSVVFAMFTNIVANSGGTIAQDLSTRLSSVEACLKLVLQDIT
jgi:hypothetical protein